NPSIERYACGVSHTAETGRAVVGEIDGVRIAVGVVVDGELGAWVDNESCRVQGCASGLEQHGAAVDDGIAGVSVVSQQDQVAGADLGQVARAADDAGQSEVGIPSERGARVQDDVPLP